MTGKRESEKRKAETSILDFSKETRRLALESYVVSTSAYKKYIQPLVDKRMEKSNG